MKKLAVLDIECYPNYFLVAIKGHESKKLLTFDTITRLSHADIKRLRNIMRSYTTFGFNSIKYDIPMIAYALAGASCEQLYKASKAIIENNQPDWMTYRNLNLDAPTWDHFDISEPAPAVMISLKNYGTRVGSRKLQDLPFDPHLFLTQPQMDELKAYCQNDLDVTIDLYDAIADRIALRVSMGEEYGMDLRSKSDAQIAEAVITSELKKVGVNATKPELPSGYRAKYTAPDFIRFDDEDLMQLKEMIEEISFKTQANGQVKMPTELANRKIVIGNTTYKMGIGGLHSQEKSLSVVSDDDNVMRNADVASYYPAIILGQGLYPKHLGKKFLTIYKRIVDRRIKAKREGNKLVADSLKITINGSFGKFGSKYSKLYSPDLLLATTITGQLSLLMLIEQLEANGIPVMSANTDGVEYYCPRDKVALAKTIIFDWELVTGYDMEHGEYQALHAANVNNYVAVYDGYTKAKGIYAETTLSKGLQTPIVYEAIRRYLLDGSRIEKTINDCAIVNDFLSARTVKGGAVWRGNYLGKMVRWYYSASGESIHYKLNNNKVPKSDGARPMMDITDELPDDLDRQWYIDEAVSKLKDLGVAYVDEK